MKKTTIKTLQINEYGASIVFNNVRLAFVYLAEPNTRFTVDKRKGTYEVTMLIEKDIAIDKQLKSIVETIVKNSPKLKTQTDKKKVLSNALKIDADGSIIKNGDNQINASTEKVYEGFEGKHTIKAKTKAFRNSESEPFSPARPLILTYWNLEKIDPIDIKSELYAGVWANVSVNLTPYDYAGKKGVTVYLTGVQKLFDDSRLGGFNPFEEREDVAEDLAERLEQQEQIETY